MTTKPDAKERTELLQRRLAAQRLATTAFTRPEEVVAWFGAMQAQDYLGALWAVGVRMTAADERGVERALVERRIVRSWPMRGTLHFVAAADARWLLELLAPKAALRAQGRLRKLGIDARLLAKARRALVKELEGGRQLTRAAAYQVLEQARVPAADERGMHVLWQLAHEGLLCFGARAGKQQTFVLLEEWLPHAPRLARDDALGELALRYFRAHGPATLRDFSWWAGLTLAEAREATNLAGQLLERANFAGKSHLFAADAGPLRAARAREFTLPAFDEFFVGYADRSAALDSEHAARVTAFQMLAPVLLLEGRMAGTWQRKLAGDKVVLVSRPFAPLDARKGAAVRAAFTRYARFVGLTPAFA